MARQAGIIVLLLAAIGFAGFIAGRAWNGSEFPTPTPNELPAATPPVSAAPVLPPVAPAKSIPGAPRRLMKCPKVHDLKIDADLYVERANIGGKLEHRFVDHMEVLLERAGIKVSGDSDNVLLVDVNVKIESNETDVSAGFSLMNNKVDVPFPQVWYTRKSVQRYMLFPDDIKALLAAGIQELVDACKVEE